MGSDGDCLMTAAQGVSQVDQLPGGWPIRAYPTVRSPGEAAHSMCVQPHGENHNGGQGPGGDLAERSLDYRPAGIAPGGALPVVVRLLFHPPTTTSTVRNHGGPPKSCYQNSGIGDKRCVRMSLAISGRVGSDEKGFDRSSSHHKHITRSPRRPCANSQVRSKATWGPFAASCGF